MKSEIVLALLEMPEVQELLSKGIGIQFAHRDDSCRVLGPMEGIHGWDFQFSGHPKVESWPCGKHGLWEADPPPLVEVDDKYYEVLEKFFKSQS